MLYLLTAESVGIFDFIGLVYERWCCSLGLFWVMLLISCLCCFMMVTVLLVIHSVVIAVIHVLCVFRYYLLWCDFGVW